MDKTKIKKLIKAATYLDDATKNEWLNLVDDANQDELTQIKVFFVKAKKAQNLYKFKIVYENGLGKKYANKLKAISDKYIKNAKLKKN